MIVDGTWGFASSSAVTKEEIARVAAAGGRDRAGEPEGECRAGQAGAGGGVPDTSWNTPVKKNPFDMPLQPKLDLLLQINDEALKVNGRELRLRVMQFVNEQKYLRVDRGLAHRAVAHPLLSDVLDHGGRSGDRQVLLPRTR